jgi:hypothetical protein
MKSMRVVLIPLSLLALSGCAVNSYCTGEMDYQTAPSIPPLQGGEGVRIPESASALKIPPPPANPVGYGEIRKDAEGDDVIHCLDKPPELPPAVAPKAEPPKAS